MKLAICIPTHHGRASCLQELLESIAEQEGLQTNDRVEICISDNASNDGTSELVELYQRASPFPVKYFRFATDMGGVRNFANVIDMAEAEYCWFVGSDDALMCHAVSRVLQLLEANPRIAGLSVNKLNFDKELRSFVGVDHDTVLPVEPWRTRLLTPFDEAFANLGMFFTYMSAHVFRREEWQKVVRAVGIEYLITLRHFPHWFVFVHMAKAADGWFWLADFLVIQRLDNSCIFEEAGNQRSIFATQLTEDLVKVHDSMLEVGMTRDSSMMRNLFLIYWNPLQILKYKSWPGISADDQRALTSQCTRWFHRFPLFWVTSYPLLLTPALLIRWVNPVIDALYQAIRPTGPEGRPLRWGGAALHLFLRALRIERGDAGHADAGAAAATQYLRRLHERDGRAPQLPH